MLCACRTGSLWLRLVILTLVVLLTMVGWATGGEPWRKPLPPADAGRAEQVGCVDVAGSIDRGTDRAQVRRVLHRGAILVAFGREMDADDHQRFVETLATHACLGKVEPIREELSPLRGALRATLPCYLDTQGEGILERLGDQVLLAALSRAADRPHRLRVEGFTAEVGFATYRHWKTRIIDRPVILKGVIRWQPVERRVALPDTHQPYVRLLPAEKGPRPGR